MSNEKSYSKEILEKQKKDLYKKRSDLLSKYQEWKSGDEFFKSKERGDIADIASELSEEMLSSVLTESEISTLKQIEEAIERIENNTYGICEGSGKLIPIERLKAIPWAKYTVEYSKKISGKERLNKKNNYPLNYQYGYTDQELSND